jgi:hypothetical protein
MLSNSLNTIDDTILSFRTRIEIGLSGFLPPNTPVCPRTGVPHGFVQRYTFEVEDLLSHIDDHVIVHHGAAPADVAQRLSLLYNACPIIYAHRALGRIDLNVQQVKHIIEGSITDWEMLGFDRQPIRRLCRGGVVQKAVFNKVAAELFGVQKLASSFTSCGGYEELAANARRIDGAIIFGLRPEFASDDLTPISINGVWPGLPATIGEYPSLPVWLSVPGNRSTSEVIRYLDLVATRIERDALALRKLADRDAMERAA